MANFIIAQDRDSEIYEVDYRTSIHIADQQQTAPKHYKKSQFRDSLALDELNNQLIEKKHKKKKSKKLEQSAPEVEIPAQSIKKKKRAKSAPAAPITKTKPVNIPTVTPSSNQQPPKQKKKKTKQSHQDQQQSGFDNIQIQLDDIPEIELDIKPVENIRKKKKTKSDQTKTSNLRQSTPGLVYAQPAKVQQKPLVQDQPQIDLSLIEKPQQQKEKKRKIKKIHQQPDIKHEPIHINKTPNIFQKDRSPSIFYNQEYSNQIPKADNQQLIDLQNQNAKLFQNQIWQLQQELNMTKQKNQLLLQQQQNTQELQKSYLSKSQKVIEEELKTSINDDDIKVKGKETNQLLDLLSKQLKFYVNEQKSQSTNKKDENTSDEQQNDNVSNDQKETVDLKLQKYSSQDPSLNEKSFQIVQTSPLRKQIVAQQQQLLQDFQEVKQQRQQQSHKQEQINKLKILFKQQENVNQKDGQFETEDLNNIQLLSEEEIENIISQIENTQKMQIQQQQLQLKQQFSKEINDVKNMILDINRQHQESQRVQMEMMQKMIVQNNELIKSQVDEVVKSSCNNGQQQDYGSGWNTLCKQNNGNQQYKQLNNQCNQNDVNKLISVIAQNSTQRQSNYMQNMRFLLADMGGVK